MLLIYKQFKKGGNLYLIDSSFGEIAAAETKCVLVFIHTIFGTLLPNFTIVFITICLYQT